MRSSASFCSGRDDFIEAYGGYDARAMSRVASPFKGYQTPLGMQVSFIDVSITCFYFVLLNRNIVHASKSVSVHTAILKSQLFESNINAVTSSEQTSFLSSILGSNIKAPP